MFSQCTEICAACCTGGPLHWPHEECHNSPHTFHDLRDLAVSSHSSQVSDIYITTPFLPPSLSLPLYLLSHPVYLPPLCPPPFLSPLSPNFCLVCLDFSPSTLAGPSLTTPQHAPSSGYQSPQLLQLQWTLWSLSKAATSLLQPPTQVTCDIMACVCISI